MQTRWDIGGDVRLLRNLRNDGTYPGTETGELLVRRGSVGTIVDVGTFLQDQIIYSVHFLDADRIVGCREEELQGAEEAWVPSRYETRERVRARRALSLGGAVCVPAGAIGEVMQVVRSEPVAYHVHFECLSGRVLAVPEPALAGLAERIDA